MSVAAFYIYRYEKDGQFYAKSEAEELGIDTTVEPTEIYLELTYTGGWVDEGIGAYEYWGIKGVDHNWQYEIEDFDSAIDEDGKDWKDLMTNDEIDEAINACIADGQNHSKDEDCDFDY